MDAGVLFDELVGAVGDDPGVAVPAEPGRSGFGSTALRVDGRTFAMLVGGELVLKLPHERVDELIAGGDGGPFRNGKGQALREWVAVTSASPEVAVTLGREALVFVRG